MCLCTINYFATGPIKVPCRPLLRLQGGFDTRAVCCRSFSYSRIAEVRSAPSSLFRMFLSSSCVGGIVGRATVIVNQLREDSERPALPLKEFVSLGYSRHTRPGVAGRRQPAQVRREVKLGFSWCDARFAGRFWAYSLEDGGLCAFGGRRC